MRLGYVAFSSCHKTKTNNMFQIPGYSCERWMFWQGGCPVCVDANTSATSTTSSSTSTLSRLPLYMITAILIADHSVSVGGASRLHRGVFTIRACPSTLSLPRGVSAQVRNAWVELDSGCTLATDRWDRTPLISCEASLSPPAPAQQNY